MGPFEEFIESKMFFPVLIGLLFLLIIIFVVILILDRKREKKYLSELKEEIGSDDSQMDMTQTIEIPVQRVVKQVVVTTPKVEERKEEVVEEKKEEVPPVNPPIVQEKYDESVEESTDGTLKLDNSVIVKPIELDTPKKIIPKTVERTEIAEDAPLINLKINDTSTDEALAPDESVTSDYKEEVNEEDLLVVPEVKQVEVEDEGEEIELPQASIQIKEEDGDKLDIEIPEEKDEEPIELPKTTIIHNAFGGKHDGNTDINEDIKYEPPHEYTGEKTEIFDISDIVNGKEE